MGWFCKGEQLSSLDISGNPRVLVGEVWLYPNTRAIDTARESGYTVRNALDPQELYSGVLCCGIGFGREGRKAFISHKARERVDYVFFLERIPESMVPVLFSEREPYLEAVLCHVHRNPCAYRDASDIAGRVLDSWNNGRDPYGSCSTRELSLLLEEALSVRERDGRKDRDTRVSVQNGNGGSLVPLNYVKARVFEDLVTLWFERLAREVDVYVATNVRTGEPEHRAGEIDLLLVLHEDSREFWRRLFSRVDSPECGFYGEGCVGGVVFSRGLTGLLKYTSGI